MTVTVFGYLNTEIFIRFYFPVFFSVLFLIKKIYRTLKHIEVRQKYSSTRRVFNSLLGVWDCGQRSQTVLCV